MTQHSRLEKLKITMEMIIIIIIIMKEKECVKILIMTCVERSNEPSYTGLHAHVVPCCHARSDHLGNHILVVLFKALEFLNSCNGVGVWNYGFDHGDRSIGTHDYRRTSLISRASAVG
ncbi:hypothetical protein AAZV13_02G149800 [Glycine max]